MRNDYHFSENGTETKTNMCEFLEAEIDVFKQLCHTQVN